jgi:hypothetical protein
MGREGLILDICYFGIGLFLVLGKGQVPFIFLKKGRDGTGREGSPITSLTPPEFLNFFEE